MSENTRYLSRAGSFNCRVKAPVNGWIGEQGEKATPFIRIPCIVTEECDQVGREIVFQGWLTENSFDRTIKALVKAFPDWNGDLSILANGGYSFAGKDCEIVADVEEYEGKPRVKAKWLNAIGGSGGGGKAMEKSKLDDLIRKMGRRSLAMAKAAHEEAGSSSTPPSARRPEDEPPPSEAGADGVPF